MMLEQLVISEEKNQIPNSYTKINFQVKEGPKKEKKSLKAKKC